ncbi:MAG: hypothetical protein ABIG92_05015 [Candidatus Omnitrophota bacterium]
MVESLLIMSNLNIDFDTLKETFITHFDGLRAFNFSYENPLFWIFYVLAFLTLLMFWNARKSFSFCTILAVILLATTKLEHTIVAKFTSIGETFDVLFIRIASAIVVVIIALYYTFMRDY